MAIQLFSNNAISLLAAPFSIADTVLHVLPGTGALFPQPVGDGSDYFLITLEDQGATIREIIRVNGRTGDTFTGIVRGLEGTTARSWSASSGADTLVDHRITAETMRLAMELPEPPVIPPIGVTVQDEGVSVGTLGSTLNFEGAGVWVTGAGAAKTITIPGSTGTAWIEGANAGPITIVPSGTEVISAVTYSQFNRGMKFFITIVATNGLSETFELLLNISGNIDADAETVSFTKYGRVGYRLNCAVSITLNKPLNQLSVVLQNNEMQSVQVMCTRIQHAA